MQQLVHHGGDGAEVPPGGAHQGTVAVANGKVDSGVDGNVHVKGDGNPQLVEEVCLLGGGGVVLTGGAGPNDLVVGIGQQPPHQGGWHKHVAHAGVEVGQLHQDKRGGDLHEGPGRAQVFVFEGAALKSMSRKCSGQFAGPMKVPLHCL